LDPQRLRDKTRM